jgi:DNA primase
MFPITDTFRKNHWIFRTDRFQEHSEAARDSVGKYINSPETIIYHKSTALFGFHHAKSMSSQKKSVDISRRPI